MSAKKKKTFGEFRWLLEHIGRFKFALIVFALEGAANSALGVAATLIIRNVIDKAVAGDSQEFLYFFLMYGAVFVISLALHTALYWQNERISFRMERQLELHLYRKLLHTQYKELDKWQVGQLMNFLNSDTKIIVNGVVGIARSLLAMLVRMCGAFFILFVWDWRLAAFFLVGGMCLLVFTAALRKISKRLYREVQESYDKVWGFLQETLGNMLIIRSFQAESRAETILNQQMEHVWSSRAKKTIFSDVCYLGFNTAMNAGYLLGLLWCGWGILQGTVSYGTLVAVLQLVGQVQSPIEGLSSLISQYNAMCGSIDRLQRMEDLPEESVAWNGFDEENTRATYEKLTCIRMEKLSFSYDTTKVFENAQLQIRKGEIVAFTGLSGIGKTTFLKLLLAVYTPESGDLCLEFSDGTRRSCDAGTRRFFSYVPQGNCLLSGTIADAVSFLHTDGGYTDGEMQEIKNACRLACAEDFISKLPKGYETVIGERGAGLSEGQLQRLAIARAIYSGAPILLLDEATSALDEATERQVLLHLKNLTDRTVVIITHRKAALEICTSIMEVRDGKIQSHSMV